MIQRNIAYKIYTNGTEETATQVVIATMLTSDDLKEIASFPSAYDAANFAKENFSAQAVLILSPAENPIFLIKIAKKLGLVIEINEQRFDLKTASIRDVAILLLRHANCLNEVIDALSIIIDELAINVLKHVVTEAIAREEINVIAAESGSQLDVVSIGVEHLKQAITERKEAFRPLHAITSLEKNARQLSPLSGPEFVAVAVQAYRAGEKRVFALSGSMGSGKTSSKLIPLFNEMTSLGANPLYLTARRSLVSSFVDDPRHYRFAGEKSSQGTIGVINSVLSDFAEEQTHGLLVIDELMCLRAHRAYHNQHISTYAKYWQALEALIQRSQIVVVADANLNDETVNWLHVIAGEVVDVLADYVTQNILLKYYKSSHQLFPEAIADLKTGKKVVLFTDEKLEKAFEYKKIFERQIHGLKVRVVDSNFVATTEGQQFVQQINEKSMEYDLLIITPVISSGVSITNNHFSKVYLLSAGTLIAPDLLQSMRRFRTVNTVAFAFVGRRIKLMETLPIAIVTSELNKTTRIESYNCQQYRTMMDDPYINKVAAQIAFENDLRNNHIAAVLTMAEQKGFTVVDIKTDSAVRKAGQKAVRKGKIEHKQEKNSVIKAAAHLTGKQCAQLDKKSTKTQTERLNLMAQRIRTVLNIKEITDPDIAAYEKGIGKTIENLRLMKVTPGQIGDKISTQQAARETLVPAIFGRLGIDTKSMIGTYNNEKAIDVLNFIKEGELSIKMQTGRVINVPAKTAYEGNFGKLSEFTNSVKFMSHFLSHFGLSHEKGPKEKDANGKRNYTYRIKTTAKYDLAMHYLNPCTTKPSTMDLTVNVRGTGNKEENTVLVEMA
ncbi:hypothetical protein [uncultured Tolumonas sp.]|uniref:hypothetical protein n=1 Tax=uncultured Tolumonas sp. TaxID=263765 RepID=UPI00292D831E|nr:hypothetical protein [uncultured Tolumonas sp.]